MMTHAPAGYPAGAAPGFEIEPRTTQLIADALPLLDKVSGDRIRHEIEFILDEDAPEDAFCRLGELGVLELLHPALHFDDWVRSGFRALRWAHAEPCGQIGGDYDLE
jgi:tRNA nucleotidyltransferase (CCA-adding enzyme)